MICRSGLKNNAVGLTPNYWKKIMVNKPLIQNWHREEFSIGFLDNIPAEVIAALEAEKAHRKEEGKKVEKVKKDKDAE